MKTNDILYKNQGHFLISQVEIEIGGQLIDKHYSQWLDIWSELSLPPGKKIGYEEMITGVELSGSEQCISYVPLQFWFCRNPGLALPLIALQYHEV